MKRFLIYSACVISCIVLLTLACDVANVWLIHNSSGNNIAKMERLWQSTHKDEIPILGSSRALGNYVPSLISKNCFNYGFNGMTLSEVLFNLQAIGENDSSDPVILNFDPWADLGECDESWVGDYRLAPNSGRTEILDFIPGIRFYGMLRKNITDYLNGKKAVTKVIDNGAVLLKTSRSEKEWAVINSKITKQHFRLVEGVDKVEKSLLALSPRKVIVVVSPCSSRWTALYDGRAQLDAFLKRIDSLPNVDVVNMYASDKFSDADFTDPTHFNIDGARKFTTLLKAEIDLLSQVRKKLVLKRN